jgi:hypothetical protein
VGIAAAISKVWGRGWKNSFIFFPYRHFHRLILGLADSSKALAVQPLYLQRAE